MKTLTRSSLNGITFFLGFASAISQVLLIRELLTVFRGNEFIIGIIFSSWFLGIFLGARLNRPAETSVLEKRVRLSLILLPLLLGVSVYGVHFIQVLLPRPVGTFYHISTEFLLSMLFTMPVSFFIGFFFPPIVDLVSRDIRESSGGSVYFIESAGSFTGGILFSFVLVEYLNPLEITALLMALSITIVLQGDKKYRMLLFIPLAVALIAHPAEKKLFTYIWNKTHSGRLLEYKRTRYQTAVVETDGERYSVYGNGVLHYSLPDRYESRNRFHLIEALRGGRKKILLFGSGPGSLLQNLVKSDVESVHYFESDPGLWDMVKTYRNRVYNIKETPGLTVVLKDLVHFLANTTETFDMIICLPAEPDNIMQNRFYTREFYLLCREHLAEKGIMVASMYGFSNYMTMDHRKFIASIYKGFTDVFPGHMATSGETIYLAGARSPDDLPGSSDKLIEDYGRTFAARDKGACEKEIVQNFSPRELEVFFEKSQLDYFKSVIAPVMTSIDYNSYLKPGGYWNQMVLSSYRDKSAVYRFIKSVFMFPLIFIVLVIFALIDIRKRNDIVQALNGLVMYITGFVSISTMIILIMLYQNFNGIVYHHISLINALFMLGLSAGSYIFNRWRIMPLPAVFASMAAALVLVMLYGFFGHLRADFLFWPLVVIFSFFCGAVFPSLFSASRDGKYFATASVLDSMDHFGSIAGSLLAVMVLIPFAGISGTVAVIGILVIAAIGLSAYMMIQKRRG